MKDRTDLHIDKLLEGTKQVDPPEQIENPEPAHGIAHDKFRPAEINYPSGSRPTGGLLAPEQDVHAGTKILRASDEDIRAQVAEHGMLLEPELAEEPIPEAGYADVYWTHFDFYAPVRRAINRVQAQYPWLTYACTYFKHPPVFERVWEIFSVDYWAGGLVNGRYVGYRGKNINTVINGWKIFNAAFNDPYLPNIAWIVYGGYMWTPRGWTTAPPGPRNSDPGHHFHPHISYYRL